jgi:hypothetical protein
MKSQGATHSCNKEGETLRFRRGSRGLWVISLLMATLSAYAADGPNLGRWDDWILDWNGGSLGAQIPAGAWVKLSNRMIDQFVVYESRRYGINLVWHKTAGGPDVRDHVTAHHNVRIVRRDSNSNLRTGHPVAIFVNGGGYLRHSRQKYGINLVWSSTPVYEWEIRDQSDPVGGGAVIDGARLGLFNRSANDYVVYCEREYGINLRWFRECDDRLRSELRADQISTDPSHPRTSTGVEPTPMKIKWRECNDGAPSEGHFTTMTFGGEEYEKSVGVLDRDECKSQSLTVMIPYESASEGYLIRVSVDAHGQYREDNETNNVATFVVKFDLP